MLWNRNATIMFTKLGSDEKIEQDGERCFGAYCLYLIYLVDIGFYIIYALYRLVLQRCMFRKKSICEVVSPVERLESLARSNFKSISEAVSLIERSQSGQHELLDHGKALSEQDIKKHHYHTL